MGAFNSQVYLDIGKLNISGLCGSSEGENVNANVNVNLELKGFLFSRTKKVNGNRAIKEENLILKRFIASTLEQKCVFIYISRSDLRFPQ